MSKKNGYTLLEILIVVAVIAIVASVTAFLLSYLKMRSADSKRMSDIKQITKALELYYDNNAKYPGRLDDLVSAGFLPVVPLPPRTKMQVFYSYVPLGENKICTGYHLGAAMETGYRDSFQGDADVVPGVPCAEADGFDFDGTAMDCKSEVPGEGAGKGNCYDIKI